MQELDEGKIYTEKSHTLWKMDEHGPSSSMSYLLKLVSFQNVKLPTGISRYELHGHMVIPNHVPSNGIRFSPCQAPGFAWPSRTVLGEPCEKIFWGMWSEETSLTDPVFELNVVFLTKGFHKTRHADSADFSHLWLTYINIHHLKCHHDTLKLGVSTTGLERSPLSPRWM